MIGVPNFNKPFRVASAVSVNDARINPAVLACEEVSALISTPEVLAVDTDKEFVISTLRSEFAPENTSSADVGVVVPIPKKPL